MFVKSKLMKSFCKTTTRAVELWRESPTRAARGGGVSGAGAPAVRPRHVEVRVEKKPQHVEVRVEEKQKIHDVRKTRIHEYSQPAETRGTVNDAVRASSRPWSTRHGPQSCILRLEPCDRRKILTRASCEGCNVARRNRKHQGPSETQKNETIEDKSIRKRTENAPRNCTSKTRPERVRYQDGEGGSGREH